MVTARQEKGVGMWSVLVNPNKLGEVGAEWFYNWQISDSHNDNRFVPMIWCDYYSSDH
jgi:hypothetical protein